MIGDDCKLVDRVLLGNKCIKKGLARCPLHVGG
jgi:hypothetical protein